MAIWVTPKLSSLPDVGISSPQDGHVLTYDSGTGEWVNEAPTSGVTDHGALTGLADDDHTQYALVTATRAFTGSPSAPGAGSNSERFGASATAAGNETVVLGKLGQASGDRNIAIGYLANASGTNDSIAIGRNCVVSGVTSIGVGSNVNVTANDAILIGVSSTSTAAGSVSIGRYISNLAERSIALGGYVNLATGTYDNVAIGYLADVDVINGIAIGRQAGAIHAAGLALGRSAITTRANQFSIGSATSPIHNILFGGSTGPIVEKSDAVTNSVSTVWGLAHNSTGTPAAGFGGSLVFQLESSTTEYQSAGLLYAVWNDATHATRKSDLVLAAYDTAEREGLRIRGNGSAAAIGFLGATPIARKAHVADPAGGSTVDAEARAAINSILVTLEDFGLHATS